MQRHEVITIAEQLYLQSLQAAYRKEFISMQAAARVHLPVEDQKRVENEFEKWKKAIESET